MSAIRHHDSGYVAIKLADFLSTRCVCGAVRDTQTDCCAYCAKPNNEHLDYTSPGTNQHVSFRPYQRQSILTQPSIQAT